MENVLYLPFVLVYLVVEGIQIGRYEENKWGNHCGICSSYALFIDGRAPGMIELKYEIRARKHNEQTKLAPILEGLLVGKENMDTVYKD